ncbi:NAD(P)-binding protein [Oceanimonas sp. NS1]|nr:NAD(P)-binding protein [Oceanimonas sp. NS1]
MDADILIIGAGSVGMAAGYYAACQGARVLLLDEAIRPIHWAPTMAALG